MRLQLDSVTAETEFDHCGGWQKCRRAQLARGRGFMPKKAVRASERVRVVRVRSWSWGPSRPMRHDRDGNGGVGGRDMREHAAGARNGAHRQLRAGRSLLPGRRPDAAPPAAHHLRPHQALQVAVGQSRLSLPHC